MVVRSLETLERKARAKSDFRGKMDKDTRSLKAKEVRSSNVLRLSTSIVTASVFYYYEQKNLLVFPFIHFAVALVWLFLWEIRTEYTSNLKWGWYVPATLDNVSVSIAVYLTGSYTSPMVMLYVVVTALSSFDMDRKHGIYSFLLSNVSFFLINLFLYLGAIENLNLFFDLNLKFNLAAAFFSSIVLFLSTIALKVLGYDWMFNIEKSRKEAVLEKEKAIVAQRETELALADLKSSQEQLVQSEKLAALGQLIAGIGHEINTPIGAIKATAYNLRDSLGEILKVTPQVLRSLDDSLLQLSEELILGSNRNNSITMKEGRVLRKELTARLKEWENPMAEDIAELLVELGETQVQEKFMPLWKQKNTKDILKFISNFSGLQSKAETIQIAVEKTVKIIYALKAYSKKDNTTAFQLTNLHEGIETVLTLYQNNLKQGIEVVREFGDLQLVSCIASDTNQIWTNLIFNSIQAMQNKGKLTIRTFHRDQKAIVQIEDTGSGIPSEILPKIFNAFYSTKGEGEGSGMGLFIVKQIVDKHLGTISVESVPGKTTFTVSLP